MAYKFTKVELKILDLLRDYLFKNEYVHGLKYPDSEIVNAFVKCRYRIMKSLASEQAEQPQDILFVMWKKPACYDVFIIYEDKLERIERDDCKIHHL